MESAGALDWDEPFLVEAMTPSAKARKELATG
ncbi:hypothetical protein MPNT_440009 [Candidatus Methylacidithermus pantelleriae]|uniref:Uncharacterized protein n=1 Tax=Candidatus Methylacidithermus pantelleriae TaxID=2744239 RepID=A0A8J2BRJ1_9BACT|nr:hypothetical protein MPNT_440009 [Candidatus Methylacidithermus pantelleriae]